jgi:Fe2+ or Zn2+ uptake regulation protein
MESFITLERRIINRMKEKGCRMTPETLLIVRHIFDNVLTEVDPETIWIAVRQKKKISRATVYNSLRRLEKWGFIRIQPRRYFVIW